MVSVWSDRQPDIKGVAVVGSWARGDATMGSDIDVVILTTVRDDYVAFDHWVRAAVGVAAEVVRTVAWGRLLMERRVRLDSGLRS